MKTLIAACLSLLVCVALPARSADEPDAVYAKYHRAAASGDLAEMARHAVAAQRSDMAGMSASQRDAMVKMLAATMPRAYVLRHKSVRPDGKNAVLIVSGPGAAMGAKPETLFGTINMASEGGEWKVADTNWSNNAPAGLAEGPAPRTAPGAPAPQKAASKAAAPAGPGGHAGPERPLGKAKEPCVYKPVMTAEDVERCR